MTMQFAKLAFLVTSCLAIRSAAAQPGAADPAEPPPPPPVQPPPVQPAEPAPAVAPAPVAAPAPAAPADPAASDAASRSVLPGVLPTSPGATIDARLDYTDFGGESDFSSPTLVAFNLRGQYLLPSGLGGYVALPIAYASGNSDSETYLGNIELGGLYVSRGTNLDVYARGALAVGAGDDEDASFAAPITNLVPRPADAFASGFGATWLRAGGGVRLTSGSAVFGGSGGVDFPIGGDNEFADDLPNVLHLTGSVGLAQPGFGLAAGVTLVQVLDDSSDDDDAFFGFQAIGDVAVGPKMRLYGALAFNFEDEGAYSLGIGVRAGL